MPTSDSVTKRPVIPSDYPHAHRLADQHVFRAVLGIASSTFARLLAEGRLPKPTESAAQIDGVKSTSRA